MLDVGFTKITDPEFMYLNKVPEIPMPDHAKWRFLINTEGVTASCRLAKVMATNSVVLNYESQFIENYYRSLQPGVHFLSINDQNVLQTMAEANKDVAGMKKIAAHAQEFALR